MSLSVCFQQPVIPTRVVAIAQGLGAHALADYTQGSNFSTTISTPSLATQAAGGTMIVCVGRGINSAHALPTDNKGNSPYVQLGTSHVYTLFQLSGTALYCFTSFAGGSGHVVTETTPSSGDEISVFAVEVKGRTVVQDFQWNEQLSGSALTSLSVTTTGPATLLAFWFGDGQPADHTAVPDNGFTVIDSFLANANNIQCAAASKEVSGAGTYNVTWTATPTQGAQLWIVAVQ